LIRLSGFYDDSLIDSVQEMHLRDQKGRELSARDTDCSVEASGQAEDSSFTERLSGTLLRLGPGLCGSGGQVFILPKRLTISFFPKSCG
jgi:hypothetical protein